MDLPALLPRRQRRIRKYVNIVRYTPLEVKILTAVCYADVFQFPLTAKEIYTWLPTDSPISITSVFHALASLLRRKKIVCKDTYYFLPSHPNLPLLRLSRMNAAQKKLQHLKSVIQWLHRIPTICMIGVTGGVAIGNANERDDIDLFLVTESGTLWITRFFSTLLVDCIAKRRHPNQKHVTNTMCLNMYTTTDMLAVPKHEREYYIAHEVLQCMPVWEKNGTYRTFLKNNIWVSRYFFHAWKEKYTHLKQPLNGKSSFLSAPIHWFCLFVMRLMEYPAYFFQLWYMRKRRTQEIVDFNRVKFHPHDARTLVRQEFLSRCAAITLPLDKENIAL